MPLLKPISGSVVQAFTLGGQARLYQNLNPAAAIPVDEEQVFRLRNFYNHHYRLNRGRELAQYVPTSRYVFVKMADGDMLMHPRYRHPALAQGRPVLYAGEAQFENGRLEWWSNASGNYRPDPGHAKQAGLPMEQFFKYEDILRGNQKQPPHQQRNDDSAQGPGNASVQAKLGSRYRATGLILAPPKPCLIGRRPG